MSDLRCLAHAGFPALLHLAVMTAKLCRPGGVRAVIAENLLLKHQLIRPVRFYLERDVPARGVNGLLVAGERRDVSIGDDNSGERTFPMVTYALIAVNVLFFFVELSGGDAFVKQWAFVPSRFLANPATDFQTLFTSMFMHGGWLHLGGNMLYLWIFGDNVEDRFGHGTFTSCILSAGSRRPSRN